MFKMLLVVMYMKYKINDKKIKLNDFFFKR